MGSTYLQPIATSQNQNTGNHSKIQPDELNFADGIAGSLTEKIVLFQNMQTGKNATAMLQQ
jgi:hypothetical protein